MQLNSNDILTYEWEITCAPNSSLPSRTTSDINPDRKTFAASAVAKGAGAVVVGVLVELIAKPIKELVYGEDTALAIQGASILAASFYAALTF